MSTTDDTPRPMKFARARIVRWLLLLPVIYVSWMFAVGIGLGLHLIIDSLCPRDLIVSGLCTARWYEPASTTVFSIGAAAAAVFIVVGCTLAAPSHKHIVAVATFLLGAAYAVVLGVQAHMWVPMIAAIVVGAAATVLVRRRVEAPDSQAQ